MDGEDLQSGSYLHKIIIASLWTDDDSLLHLMAKAGSFNPGYTRPVEVLP
jgi:hypothetical protein